MSTGQQAPNTIPIAATSYYVGLHPDYRVDVFPNGRAILVGPTDTTTCYPTPTPSRGQVTGCVLIGANNARNGTITFSHGGDDAPVFAGGTFTVPNVNTQGLYAR